MIINNIDLEEYKKHPRTLEIRFVLFFDVVAKDYGYENAIKFIKSLCTSFNCNFTFINAVINKRFDIKRNGKSKRRMWRQEVLFSAAVYNEKIYRVANLYLGIKPSTIYAQSDIYDINKFLNDDWICDFEDNIVICGENAYRVEISRFLEVVDTLAVILKDWNGDR